MDGPGDYYTKSDKEKQILYDTTFMRNLKKKKWYIELTFATEANSQT